LPRFATPEHAAAGLAAILDAAVDGIITIEESGRIDSVNRAAEEIFGYQADEIVARKVNMLMPSSSPEEYDQYLRAFLETGRRKIIGSGRARSWGSSLQTRAAGGSRSAGSTGFRSLRS
jgi:PAS domain S-box-containing protein